MSAKDPKKTFGYFRISSLEKEKVENSLIEHADYVEQSEMHNIEKRY